MTEHIEEQLVVFQLGQELYGLEIGAVQEIITWQPVTKVPEMPEYVEGLINLRGRIIPVLDLRKRFRLAQAETGRQTRIVVVEIGTQVVGLIVDGVSEVLRVAQERIVPPDEMIAGVGAEYLRGVAKTEDRLIILLEADRILGSAEQVAMKAS